VPPEGPPCRGAAAAEQARSVALLDDLAGILTATRACGRWRSATRSAEGQSLGGRRESGSGKSLTMLAVMGLVPYPGSSRGNPAAFKDRDLTRLSGRSGAGSPARAWR